jgi:hypothetical protein
MQTPFQRRSLALDAVIVALEANPPTARRYWLSRRKRQLERKVRALRQPTAAAVVRYAVSGPEVRR